MKRITLFFIVCVLASLTMSSQDVMTIEDVENSGCMSMVRGEKYVAPIPTIVLTKEGSVLSVQLLNYESNCGTTDFNVTSTVSGVSDSIPYSVKINVVPYIPGDDIATCVCPYNVSFTVHDVEANSFYLLCWWYEGQVTLEEGTPLVLEDVFEEATIEGMKYTLRKAMSRAMLTDGSTQEGEVRIPSELNYEGKVYSVTSIDFSAFNNNKSLTKVIIPKTIKNMDLSNNINISSNLFSGCTALQLIDVEEDNPALCSVDGVLFNKEKTMLLSYPAGAPQKSYSVPESVTSVAGLAFSYSQYLQNVWLSDKVTSLGSSAFYESKNVEEVRMPSKLAYIGNWMFANCSQLKSIEIPQGVTSIGNNVFKNCTALTSLDLPKSVNRLGDTVFEGCMLNSIYIRGIINPKWMSSNIFRNMNPQAELYVLPSEVEKFKAIYKGPVFPLPEPDIDIAYRPFVEDGKVWVVRCNPALGISDASWIEYYYFDGDSIIDGHRCKIMKSVSNVNEDNWVNGVFTPDGLPQYYVGAFYEQDRKVYYKQNQQPFEQIYDFTLSSNDIYSSWGYPVAVQKISGVIPGFKGTYYEFWLDNQILGRWFEGIGCNTSLPYISHPWNYYGGGSGMLLSCFVGDEVIYLNNEYEDGVIPIEARKGRFDFTHTIKTQPRAPRKREVNSSSLYGEYNEQKLTIHLDPLYDTYLVRITDETGKAVYEKTVNTSTIVGLNIDISAYAAGRYAVTVENSLESFTGEFRILTTEIKEVRNGNKEAIDVIYNLQGQRLSGKPAKGVYIENGKKRLVK